MTKFFMNERKTIVSDAIDGTLYANPYNNLIKLDIDPYIRVVIRKDWDKSKVALISGGGSGHEPAHVGFVGKGMLTAAVCGDVFASPSVEAVFNTIVNVTGDAGCLLIVKNYTGDRLNFGLAAEKAKKLGYNVELVMVSDDISIPDNKQPRGIAGTAFVHKVAGYVAEQGESLQQVSVVTQQAIDATSSIGVAISSCNLPAEDTNNRVAPGCAELGLGIHGEAGVSILDTQTCLQIVDAMVEKLLINSKNLKAKRAILINNLGGVSPLEMNLITKDIVESALNNYISHLIGPAPIVTALDMKGFSISCLELTPLFERAIKEPVEAMGWQPVVTLEKLPIYTTEKLSDIAHPQPSSNPQNESIINCICGTLIELEKELNRLDALVGDGDTGSTFAAGARQIMVENQASTLPLNNLADLFAVVGERLAKVMGGSSGVLMSIFFTAAGQKISEGHKLSEALLLGLDRMKHYGGANLGDRTMIDALQPALEAMDKGSNIFDIAYAAHKGSESTAKMQKANAGRSSYLSSDSLNGIKDPGAVAVEMVFSELTSLAQ